MPSAEPAAPAHLKLPSFAFRPDVSLLKLFNKAPCVLTLTLDAGACAPTTEACGETDGMGVHPESPALSLLLVEERAAGLVDRRLAS